MKQGPAAKRLQRTSQQQIHNDVYSSIKESMIEYGKQGLPRKNTGLHSQRATPGAVVQKTPLPPAYRKPYKANEKRSSYKGLGSSMIVPTSSSQYQNDNRSRSVNKHSGVYKPATLMSPKSNYKSFVANPPPLKSSAMINMQLLVSPLVSP